MIRTTVVSPFTNPTDFRAFYCAGRGMLSGYDPYRVEPLRRCEQAAALEMGVRLVPALVVPAPLPPYALAAFGFVARLPFPDAIALWFWLLFISTLGVTVLLRTMTGLSAVVIAVAWTISTAPSVLLGQMAPIVAFLIVSCAYFSRQRRYAAAAFCSAPTMVEPHIGLPCCVALFLFLPGTRRTLAGLGLAIFAVTLASGGWPLSFEYAIHELPSHARSELFAPQTQYSLSTLLAVSGLSPRFALLFGQLDYLLMLVIGLATARVLSRRFDDPSLFALLPPAFMLLGGMYIHIYQFIIALPLAAILYAHATRERRPKAAYLWSSCGVMTAIVIDVFYQGDFVRAFTHDAARSMARIDAADLASEIARIWHTARMPHDVARMHAIVIAKAPGVIGLLVLVAATVREAFVRRDAVAALRIEWPATRSSSR